jgi:NADPH:quinone reductase-like Zn-dependent oxidoreductase
MRAIILKKYGKANEAFEFQEKPKPEPKNGEVLIKVNYSGLNFADILARVGLYEDAPKPPSIIGYDVSGIIQAVGPNVTTYKVGQRVAALTRFGGYAEYAIANTLAITALPDNIELSIAPAFATQACTAYYCAVDSITLHKREKVLIQAAAGGVGSILVQIAKHKGCEVFATASTSKIQFVKDLGADHVIDYTKENFADKIKTIAPKGIDVVFDSIGGQAFKKGYKLLRPGGKMICFGAADNIGAIKNKLSLIPLATGFGLFSPIPMLMQSKSLIMVNMLRIADYKPEVFSELFSKTMALAEQGIIKPHMGKIFKVAEIAAAHDFLEGRKSMGKVVVEWD